MSANLTSILGIPNSPGNTPPNQNGLVANVQDIITGLQNIIQQPQEYTNVQRDVGYNFNASQSISPNVNGVQIRTGRAEFLQMLTAANFTQGVLATTDYFYVSFDGNAFDPATAIRMLPGDRVRRHFESFWVVLAGNGGPTVATLNNSIATTPIWEWGYGQDVVRNSLIAPSSSVVSYADAPPTNAINSNRTALSIHTAAIAAPSMTTATQAVQVEGIKRVLQGGFNVTGVDFGTANVPCIVAPSGGTVYVIPGTAYATQAALKTDDAVRVLSTARARKAVLRVKMDTFTNGSGTMTFGLLTAYNRYASGAFTTRVVQAAVTPATGDFIFTADIEDMDEWVMPYLQVGQLTAGDVMIGDWKLSVMEMLA
jgi:hypothetical protein